MKAHAHRKHASIIIVGLLAALLAGAAIGWAIWGRESVHEHVAGMPASGQTVPTENDNRQYTCSMHPQVRSPNPKDKCPICGMDLIPVPISPW